MVSLTRYAIALIIVTNSLGLCAFAVAQENPVKRAVVTGTVTIKGKPAPDVAVIVRLREFSSPYDASFQSKTDKDGKYRITDIPSGQYSISPIAPAFVRSDRTRVENLTVIGEETVEGINFDLQPGAAVSGKITDSDGRPLIEQAVYLVPAEESGNQRRPSFTPSQTQTDDRGFYRIFGIAPGRYKVAAGARDRDFYIAQRRALYKQTFYSDPSDSSKPMVIEVSEGSDIPNVNIALEILKTFAVTGRLVDGETGKPLAGVWSTLQSVSEQNNSYSNFGTSNSQGEFRFGNLRPGKYGVAIGPQPDKNNIRSETVTFEIADQDVNGLVVKSFKGGTVSGVVVLENSQEKAILEKLFQLQISGYIQKNNSGVERMNWSTIAQDGSFTLNGLETGSLYVTLSASEASQMKGFKIARIERNGALLGTNIEVKSGERITDIRVIVTYGAAIVHGVVKFENGALPAGSRAYVVALKDGTNLSSSEVDGRGNFIIEGLPPGLYEIEVSVYTAGSAQRSARAVRQQVNVSNGVVTDMVIDVGNPGPKQP